MPTFALNVLGGFALSGPDGPIAIAGKKHAALLAFLACTHQKHSREKLAALFWGDHDEAAARQSLRQALVSLRRLLGDEAIVSQSDVISLSDGSITSDVVMFEALVADGSGEALDRANELYKGSLLEDFILENQEWEDWLSAQRQRVESLALDALIDRGESLLQESRGADALALAQRAVAIDAFREDAHRLAIRAAIADGRRSQALRLYQQFADVLRRELDLEPDAETRKLIEGLATAEPRAEIADPVVRDALSAATGPTVLAVEQRAANDGRSREQCDPKLVASLGQGRAVDRVGPTTFVEFADPRSAVQAAREAIGSDVRMGLHSGTDHGSMRAVAAGAAATADPGELIATGDVCDRIVDSWDAMVEDLGERRVGPTGARTRLYRLARAEGTSGARLRSISLLPAIAVLPFEAAGRLREEHVIGDFLADEIIAAMALCQEMAVLSRLSTRLFRGSSFSLDDIAGRLKANYVLWGDCELRGAAVQIRTELTDVHSQEIIWQDRFTVPASPIVQDSAELVDRLLQRICASVLKHELTRSRTQPLLTLDNYTLLTAAISLMHGTSVHNLDRAQHLLEHLVGRLEHHALPLAWLAQTHMFRVALGMSADPDIESKRAIDLARRATDIDPSCTIAHAIEAWVQLHLRKRFDIAADELALALQCNRHEPTSWLLKSAMHAFRGEGTEAIAASERALRLSPLDPRRSYFDCLAAAAYLAAGQPDEATECARRSLRINRQHSSTLRALIVARVMAGHPEEARALVPDLMQLEPGLTVSGYLRRHPAANFPIGRQWAQALRTAGVPD